MEDIMSIFFRKRCCFFTWITYTPLSLCLSLSIYIYKWSQVIHNNVPSRLSPQWLCGNSCTWAHVNHHVHHHAQVHELPQSHCSDNWEGMLFSWLHTHTHIYIYIYIILYPIYNLISYILSYKNTSTPILCLNNLFWRSWIYIWNQNVQFAHVSRFATCIKTNWC